MFESDGHVSNLGTISNIKDKEKEGENVLNLLMVKHDPKIISSDDPPQPRSKLFSSKKKINLILIKNPKSFVNFLILKT